MSLGPADLWSILTAHAGHDDRLLIRYRYTPEMPPDGDVAPAWVEHPAHGRAGFLAACLVGRASDLLVSPVPRDGARMARVPVLWARLDSAAQAKQLAGLRAGPTMVLREGRTVRRFAVWALSTPLTLEWSEKANKRLSFRLGTARKWAVPEMFWIPVPGTALRFGREKRPLEVVCEYGSLERVYTARQIVGLLKDPPAPNTDWKEKVA